MAQDYGASFKVGLHSLLCHRNSASQGIEINIITQKSNARLAEDRRNSNAGRDPASSPSYGRPDGTAYRMTDCSNERSPRPVSKMPFSSIHSRDCSKISFE